MLLGGWASHSGEGREGGLEGVGFTGKVALAFVIDGGKETVADDVGGVCEFDVGRAVPETVYSEFGKGDEVLGTLYGEDGMTNLSYDDGASCEKRVEILNGEQECVSVGAQLKLVFAALWPRSWRPLDLFSMT